MDPALQNQSLDLLEQKLTATMGDVETKQQEFLENMEGDMEKTKEEHRDKGNISVPRFKGLDSQDVFEFIENFELAANSNGWKKEHRAVVLPLQLEEKAKIWFDTIPDSKYKPFNDLVDLLKQNLELGQANQGGSGEETRKIFEIFVS